MNQQERITAMAKIMVEARRAMQDVGDIVAAALHDAAKILGSVDALVAGRPGSWEADIVLKMANDGGTGRTKMFAKERIDRLSSLFVEMGKAGEDGGDILSQAMGKAVDELGGLNAFVGGSRWSSDVRNIGSQHSNYWDQY